MLSIRRFFFAAFIATTLLGPALAAGSPPPVDEFIVQEAQSFEGTLSSTWPTKGKDAAGWLAEAEQAIEAEDHRAATGYLAAAAILDKANAGTWLKLAR